MQSSLQFQEATLARAHGTYLARVQIEIQGSTASSYDMTNRVTLLASIIVPFNLLTVSFSVSFALVPRITLLTLSSRRA